MRSDCEPLEDVDEQREEVIRHHKEEEHFASVQPPFRSQSCQTSVEQ